MALATEYVAPGGRMVAWAFYDSGVACIRTIVAVRGNDGVWHGRLVDEGPREWEYVSRSLRRVRMSAIMGNGRRYGGHSNVTAVKQVSQLMADAMLRRWQQCRPWEQ